MKKERTYHRKILVTNPGKQYVHQLLYTLKISSYPFCFFTSFWYKPGRWPFNILSLFPERLKIKIEKEFKKRFDERLESEAIEQMPLFEVVREMSDKFFSGRYTERMLFLRDRIHDRWVSSRLDDSYQWVIGYEESSLLTFRKAKRKGCITILDLAQIHYKGIEEIRSSYPVFEEMYKDKKLRERINRIKEEELSLSDHIICLSEFAKETLIKNGCGPEKIFVVNLGFDPLKFKAKEKYSSSGKLKVVYAGTLTRRKGIDVILQAAKELSPIMELILIGPMADAEDLLKEYEGNYVRHSYVDHETLNLLLNEADLFVFPSYLDSWAMVVIEAMACGLPVIVSHNTGAKEAVEHDSGFVIPPGDPGAVKEKISYFYEHRDELERMGRNARTQAMKYTWDRYQSRIREILKEIMHE